jgi:microcystin-dependent protein
MDPYLGEIRMFGGTFAPVGWVLCSGQMLDISQNEALYSLLGTTYGGDGQTTFGVPDLRGRVPIHKSSAYPMGAIGGVESVTLTSQQLATHTHAVRANAGGSSVLPPTNAVWAANSDLNCYTQAQPNATFNPGAISAAGGNQPHENMMPYLTVSFIMATEGIYPTPN